MHFGRGDEGDGGRGEDGGGGGIGWDGEIRSHLATSHFDSHQLEAHINNPIHRSAM